VAAELDRVDPGKAYELRGNIALARKDFAAAEQDYKQAIAVSPHPAEKWTVLAGFYRRQKRWNDLDNAIHNCVTAAARESHPGVALYDGAGVLMEAGRDPALAAKMLEDYLASSSKSEEAPAFIAHIRLARLKQKLGDAEGARRELAAARAMAHEFNPSMDPDR
jgi:predicted negative regulator of RcsB-dependent stress response